MRAHGLIAGLSAGSDEVSGNNRKLRQWLEEQRLGYVLAIARDQRMRWPDSVQRRVDAIAQSLPNLAWERVSAGSDSKGERLDEWTLIRGWEEGGLSHGLLVRRSIEQEPEHACYWFYAPTSKATLDALVHVAGQRCFGPNGEDSINSIHYDVTTGNEAHLCQSSIYNCCTRAC